MRNLLKIQLTPLTAKRLKNFMRIRRAKWSLRLIIILYVISLGSELICNSQPLLMHFDGRWFMPFIKSPTMQSLTGNASDSALVNYQRFTLSPAFTTNSANFAIWAPVRFSPDDTIDAATLDDLKTVTVNIVPEVFACRFNLLSNQKIVRMENCARFFPDGYDFSSETLSDHWNIPEEVFNAAQLRFQNQSSERIETEIFQRSDTTLKAILTMPEFEPQPHGKPKSIRISLRLEGGDAEAPLRIRFRYQNQILQPLDKRLWQIVPESMRAEIKALVCQSFSGEKAETEIQWKDRRAKVSCILNEISWPYPPVKGHLMGIDSAGRDVLAQVLYALRISMTFGIVLSLWAMLIGIIFGALQGYFGGKVDICGQRLTEIWSAMPFLYIMILIGAVLGRSFLLLLIVYGFFNWLGMSYYMRAEFLRLRKHAFVEAARCQGLSPLRIIFSHILPNAITPMITMLPFTLAGAIGSLAALDFLGFGLPPMTPSWGQLLQQAQLFRWAWWLILFPSLALVLVILLTVIIGEGLRDAFDPRQHSRME